MSIKSSDKSSSEQGGTARKRTETAIEHTSTDSGLASSVSGEFALDRGAL